MARAPYLVPPPAELGFLAELPAPAFIMFNLSYILINLLLM
jgi:hypothetical protein